MDSKGISRKQAKKLVWTKIWEIGRPGGSGIFYVCPDEIVEYLLKNIWKIWETKWTIRAESVPKGNFCGGGVSQDKTDKLRVIQNNILLK